MPVLKTLCWLFHTWLSDKHHIQTNHCLLDCFFSLHLASHLVYKQFQYKHVEIGIFDIAIAVFSRCVCFLVVDEKNCRGLYFFFLSKYFSGFWSRSFICYRFFVAGGIWNFNTHGPQSDSPSWSSRHGWQWKLSHDVSKQAGGQPWPPGCRLTIYPICPENLPPSWVGWGYPWPSHGEIQRQLHVCDVHPVRKMMKFPFILMALWNTESCVKLTQISSYFLFIIFLFQA